MSLRNKESVYCPTCRRHTEQERGPNRGERYCGTCGETFTLDESRKTAMSPTDAAEKARELVRGWTQSLPLGDVTSTHYTDLASRITSLIEAERKAERTRCAALEADVYMDYESRCFNPERTKVAHEVCRMYAAAITTTEERDGN